MTAQVAVLNRASVALATDSAGQIANGNEAKIYNTVNKLFKLSDSHPIGIMVYEQLDYMGLPLEVIIGEFRVRRGHIERPTLRDYANDFLAFLEREMSPRDETAHLRSIIRSTFEGMKTAYHKIERASHLLKDESPVNVDGIFELIASGFVETRAAAGPYRSDLSPEFLDVLKCVIEETIAECFCDYNLSAKSHALIHKAAELAVVSLPVSPAKNGLVFAGFGTTDLFPALYAIEVDGVLDGKLKQQVRTSVEIDRYRHTGKVVGFAQDDMVQRFVHGVDPAYSEHLPECVSDLLSEVIDAVDQCDVPQELLDLLREALRKVPIAIADRMGTYQADRFEKPTVDLVRFMPKQELARLAESMIEITSLKRRVSWGRETVGGYVDVAVISRAEGFVWIKKKHYFPRDLNPIYRM